MSEPIVRGEQILGVDHVGINQILVDIPKDAGKELTGAQRAGLRLALGVGAVIAVLIGTIFGLSFYSLPPTPHPPANATPDSIARYKELVDLYKVLSETTLDRAIRLFQAMVASTLLPVFTGILGYIFGERSKG